MDKEILLKNREKFFKEITNFLLASPNKMDDLLDQSKYYISPDINSILNNAEYGDLAIPIKGSFNNKEFNFYYTFWQVGDTFKIGIALFDEGLQGAFVNDPNKEITTIWNEETNIDVSHEFVFYDWEFYVPNLYDGYKYQEKFILGIRHMHFRVLKIIFDEYNKIN